MVVQLIVRPVNDAPTIEAGDDVEREATAPSTPVSIAPVTNDLDGDDLTYVWRVENNVVGSGATLDQGFGVGSYRVTVEVSDGNGGTAQDEVFVVIRDTTAPTLHGVPGDVLVAATSASGAEVLYAMPAATDIADAYVEDSASHGPGAFPLGSTLVEMTATDDSGNQTRATFTVRVLVGFGGFLSPLEPGRIHRAGSTIPVKFRLAGPSAGLAHLQATCLVDGVAVGTFRYDETGGVYHFNWNTRGYAPGAHTIQADLGDRVVHAFVAHLR